MEFLNHLRERNDDSCPADYGSLMKVALVCQDDISFWLFRRGLIKALVARGCQVFLISSPGPYVSKLKELGASHIPMPFHPYISPLLDLRVWIDLWILFRREKFNIVHNFTIKPNIYGATAGRLAGVPLVLNSVTGLGYLLHEDREGSLRISFTHLLARSLYRLAGLCVHRCWFQNPDDMTYFVNHRLISSKQAVLVRSSGIDLGEWCPISEKDERRLIARQMLGLHANDVAILMVARAIKPKGVEEFIQAAEILNIKYPQARFFLAGEAEMRGAAAVPLSLLRDPQRASYFCWLGQREDIQNIYYAADIVTLPSFYGEGVPRSLLEAMALAKPIVTSDWRGCRETVENGVNGFLVQPRHVPELVAALAALLDVPELRRRFGKAGRSMVERQFSEEIVMGALFQRLYAFEEFRMPRHQTA